MDINTFIVFTLTLFSIKPEAHAFDVEALLSSYYYPFENHEVQTEDGYILTVHRVPYGRNQVNTDTKRPPVLVMHGLLSSSVDLMFLGTKNSIIPMLADAGFDVWAGNNRGNTWSRKHVSLDPDTDNEFWEFSFHEMGYYDDTAIIDYILNATGHEKLFYVGHSLGASQYFAMASTRPEYNDKILLMSALAPLVHRINLTQPLVRLLAANYDRFDGATNLINAHEVFSHSDLLESFCNLCCTVEVCSFGLYAILGFDSDQLNQSVVPAFYQTFPGGTSMKSIKHIIQGHTYGKYAQYNYGTVGNLLKYFRLTPPPYDLSLVTSPVALYYSQNDWFVATEDVDRLADELPNLEKKYLIENEMFTHGDFMYAKDVAVLVNSQVISLMNEYVNN